MINMQRQQGIALIQILLITAILTVFALYMTQTARQQLTMGYWASDRAQAQVELHSAQSQLLFTMLTQPLSHLYDEIPKQPSSPLESSIATISQSLNLHGQAFSINEHVTARVKDQAGLIHARYPLRYVIKALIGAQGYNETQVDEMVDALLDWQDLDNITASEGAEIPNAQGRIRNGALPDMFELQHITQIPARLYPLLRDNLTAHRRGNFNPMNSSVELLSALTSAQIAQQVSRLRDSQQLTKQVFIDLTDITENDEIYLYPSNYFTIELVSEVGDTVVTKKITIKLLPTASNKTSPINQYLSRG